MKKLLIFTLVFTLMFSMVGCATLVSKEIPATETQVVIEETQPVTEIATEAVTEAATQAQTKATETGKKISEKEAKDIALKHAGLKEADVTALFAELDYDDGILRYEVDFRQGATEYDYEIDAKTGKILSYDKDIDD